MTAPPRLLSPGPHRWVPNVRWRRLSLRTRLSVIVAAAVAAAVLTVSAAAWLSLAHELRSAMNDQLRADARPILAVTDHAGAARASLPSSSGPDPLVQVILPDGSTRAPAGQETLLPVSGTDLRVALGQHEETFDLVKLPGREAYLVHTTPTRDGAVKVARDGRFFDVAMARLTLVLFLISLAGIAGAGLAGRAVARAGLAPVDRLTAVAVRVARTKDLDATVPDEGGGEIGRLVQAINDMLAALRSSRHAQRLMAEDAAHELRTPLTSLRTNIELLLRLDRGNTPHDTALSPQARARLLDDLGGQVVELSTLVAELTDLARGDITDIAADTIDLAEVVAAAVARSRTRNPDLTITTDLAFAPVVGRPAALQRAVLNLLDNAATWSPTGQPVQVRLTLDEPHARLEVDDAGPGIDEADALLVFDRFYRADSARALPGSGLGLSIVQRVVHAHDGHISVTRSTRGGALMRVTLPLASEP